MNLTKTFWGIFLVGAAASTGALAQKPVASGTSAPIVRGGDTFARGETMLSRPLHRFPDVHSGWPKDRDRGRHHRFGLLLPIWGLGYWGYGGGYVYTEPSRDRFGYFGAGGDVNLVDGEAVYDYDRGYPYDWYTDPPSEAQTAPPAGAYRCETRRVPNDSGGGTVPVRICRR